MIEINNVTKIYSKNNPPAVNSLTLKINDGEILGLVGLNGAGKTTTIRMIAGILLPTSGKISVDGFDVVREKVKASNNVGWIPELPNFEPNAKPLQLMRYFAGFYKNNDEMEKKIRDLLDMVGLSNDLNKKLREYSQGMKKRFAIAESLINDPKNVLFDETLNGLDPEGVKFVRNLILELKLRERSILLSSHILTEIENLADRVAIISHGKLIKTLTKSELKNLGKMKIYIEIINLNDFRENVEKILKKYGTIEKTDGQLILTDLNVQDNEIPNILDDLISNKIKVRKFEPVGESLEEYFFKLIGERQ
ncbi:MAG: ABC transporter ATP-binding protein [Thermoplasmata archaeon]|nr:ABC transporter ATP-binding protein [Thermoplasmata archaeon]